MKLIAILLMLSGSRPRRPYGEPYPVVTTECCVEAQAPQWQMVTVEP